MVSVSDISAMQGFIRLCSDGWLQGWHERNGGNLSYRMAKREIEECESFFAPREWVKLGIQADNLKGECFIVTGAGRYIRNVALDPRNNICIVELNSKGDSYRIVWGLEEGGRPTSELESHILDHSVKKIATGGENRVMYHAHPANIVALSFILPHTAKDFSRALWKSMKECPAVFPRGVGVVPRVAAAGEKLARASYELMREFDAIVWAHHGMLCSGRDFDEAFGLMHTVEKSAEIYLKALSCGKDILHAVSDDDLKNTAKELGVILNESFLE